MTDRPTCLTADAPFGERTTLGVGGRAAWGARVDDVQSLRAVIRWARDQRLPWRVFGEGSNTLVSDDGFDGVLIDWTPESVTLRTEEPFIECSVEAGANWDDVVRRAVEANGAGVECLAGIPGTAGAAPIQNIGAYGQELADVASSVVAYDTVLDTVTTIPARACAFRYRDSRFKSEDRGRFVILAVNLRLREGGAPTLAYKDLARHFETFSGAPPLAEVRDAVLEIRRTKSMVIDPADPESRSAGSFFTNPIIHRRALAQLSAAATRNQVHEPIPTYPAGADRVKVPAAWLIERAGVAKGHTIGSARVSRKHTLAIVAEPGAKARDVVAVAAHVYQAVRDVWGIGLVPEPGFVGFDRSVTELLEQPP